MHSSLEASQAENTNFVRSYTCETSLAFFVRILGQAKREEDRNQLISKVQPTSVEIKVRKIQFRLFRLRNSYLILCCPRSVVSRLWSYFYSAHQKRRSYRTAKWPSVSHEQKTSNTKTVVFVCLEDFILYLNKYNSHSPIDHCEPKIC